MSIEKSIQNLIKAIQQPTRYMGDEPSIKVVPKPGNDPCSRIFEPRIGDSPRKRKRGIAARDICAVVSQTFQADPTSIGYCKELVDLHPDTNAECLSGGAGGMFMFETSLHEYAVYDKVKIITSVSVASACETYAQSQLAAVSGQISQVQKNAILKKAKCACYKHAIYGAPAIKPNPPRVPLENGEIIYPKHVQEQVYGAFYIGCPLKQLRKMCTTFDEVLAAHAALQC